MGINIHNYEQYFLDHLEGNLSPALEKELSIFLAAHPELKPLLEDFDPVPIPPDEKVIFHPKERLKKNIVATPNIHEGNVEEWMISAIEGLLEPLREKELAEFIQRNPVFRKEFDVYRKTRLNKDESIFFPNKEMLVKKAQVFSFNRVMWVAASIAAAILLFFGIRFFITPVEDTLKSNPVQIATHSVEAEIHDTQIPSSHPVENLTNSNPHAGNDLEKPVRRTALNHNPAQRQAPFRVENAYPPNPIPSEQDILALVKMKKVRKTAAQTLQNDKPLIVKVADNLFARAERNVKDNIPLDRIGKQKFGFWGLLNSGIKGYNTVTDRNIELFVRRDDDGKVSSYTLVENDRLITTRDMNRN
jgi:hypothetical protein